jgi:integrase
VSHRHSFPRYRRHKPSGQAVVTLTDPTGTRKDFYLGSYGSKESKAEYARLLGEWSAAGRSIPQAGPVPSDLTVAEVLLRFWRHAEGYYQDPDGRPAGELQNYRDTLRPLKAQYAHTLAREFGPLALKAVRESMIAAGLSRKVINQRVGRIKRVFKWAVAEQLVPADVYHGLQAVAGLGQGRTTAPDPAPIEPVADDVVEKTLPKLPRHVRGLVQFMRLTGARPGEACQLRPLDIDMTGQVWTFRPARHKTAWRGRPRVVFIGPKAQALLAEFPTAQPTDYVFSPGRARVERFAAMRAGRKSRVQPSQINRAKRRPKRRPGVKYTSKTLHRAVERACTLAGVPAWHPNQLRHTAATEIRKRFGLEAAQVALGHAKADITQVYAERDQDLAARVALTVG